MSAASDQPSTTEDFSDLVTRIRGWARELGFADLGITLPDTGEHGQHLQDWLAEGYHGEMEYMAITATSATRHARLCLARPG